MQNYLDHMQHISGDTSFGRRLEYLKYNYSPYVQTTNKSDIRILDIGPGKGEFVALVNEKGIANIDILDQDRGVLKHCEGKYKIAKAIRSTGGDPSKYLKGRYDLITLTQVFEHIPKSEYIPWLRGLYTHLNPGGKIVITVPNGANPFIGTERYGDLQHENIFTIYAFHELMTFADLKHATYELKGFEIPPNGAINIIRKVLQKILFIVFISLMIINGGLYQTLLTPNITLVVTKEK